MGTYADIQILERNADNIVLSWPVDTDTTVSGFKLYVSTDPTGTSPVYTAVGPAVITNAPSGTGYAPKQVVYSLTEAAVRALGGTFATAEFQITPLYLRAVTIVSGTPEPVANAKTKPLQAQSSAPSARLGSIRGAAYVTSNPLNDDNITVERTIVGGNVTQELYYVTGSPSGSRAKLIVYTGPWSTLGKATKEEIYDVLKP